MADIAASVLARLKNKAAESGRSYQLCLQLFCQEEFLRRLEKSKYAENLVLKGGLFIYSLTDFDSRVTVDVDFLLRQMPNTPEQLKTVLEEIIATPTRDEKSRTFSSNPKRSHILRTSSRSRRLILSSIVSFAVWLKCTRTI